MNLSQSYHSGGTGALSVERPGSGGCRWRFPIRAGWQGRDHRPHGEGRAGMIAGCTLSCYLRLIDASSRVLLDGKASLGPELGPIFQRLKLDQDAWQVTLSRLLTRRGWIPRHLSSRSRSPASERAGNRPRFLTVSAAPWPTLQRAIPIPSARGTHWSDPRPLSRCTCRPRLRQDFERQRREALPHTSSLTSSRPPTNRTPDQGHDQVGRRLASDVGLLRSSVSRSASLMILSNRSACRAGEWPQTK